MMFRSAILCLVFFLFIFLSPGWAGVDEFPYARYESLLAVSGKVESLLRGEQRKMYLATHVAFVEYLEAEKENLLIFRGEFKTRKETIYIYRDNLAAIVEQRHKELESILNKDRNWISQKTRSNVLRSFPVINKRVPYDRGESLRPTFRAVDRAWKRFVSTEEVFYTSFTFGDAYAVDKCRNVLYEIRLRNIQLEHKGVIAIKIEKEE